MVKGTRIRTKHKRDALFFQTCFDVCIVTIREELGICCNGLPMIINMSHGHVNLAHRLVVCPVYMARAFFMDSQEQLDIYREFYWNQSPKEWFAGRDYPRRRRKRRHLFRGVLTLPFSDQI